MHQRFKEHIDKNLPFIKDKKLLIAISGGLDSVVLTHLCNLLSLNISLAHCNFKLRKYASDQDKEFVINLAQKSYNQIFTINFDTKNYAKEQKKSIQIAARELRYQWFQELAETHHFDYIFTAHHADDNLETFLINLTRGSGIEGFTGIPVKKGNIIRPLLPFSRAEILMYAKEKDVKWREDTSNASTKYIRNKIRHQIVPVLKEINPSLIDSFSKTLSHLQASQQLIENYVKEISEDFISKKGDVLKIDILKIHQLSNPKAYLYQFLKEYHFTEWENIYDLLSAQSGKQVFSKTHVLLKDRDFLFLSELKKTKKEETVFKIEKNRLEISFPVCLKFDNVKIDEEITKKKKCIYVDQDLLTYPLIVRKWENGDYFYPLGMLGKKKLSKYFKDEKLSLFEKEQVWLLCNANNDIIWILNHRQDRRFIISDTTKNSLKITDKT